MKLRTPLLVTSLLVLCLLGGSSVASAASKILTLTPTATHIRIDAGTSKTGSLQLLNQGEGGYDIRVYPSAYSVKGEVYTPDFANIPGKPAVKDWIKLSNATGRIDSNQSLEVQYTVTVPAGTAPGGYYAVVFAESKSDEVKAGVTVNQRLGEIFYIRVNGPVREQASVLNWDVPFWQAPPLTTALRMKNDGGVHTAATVHIRVSDVFNHTKYDLTTQKELLPQTIRKLPLSWNKTPPLGLFKVTGTIDLLGKTRQLPTKYVLVVSPLLRAILGAVVVTALIYAAARITVRHKSKPKAAKTP